MSTSLKEQLERLAVPQTNLLVDSKKRASILFDPKDAANKDRKTIYDLGHSGLIELIALNPSFLQFEETLFNRESISVERAVESSKVNKLLDKAIRKFFYHLSPYFMLQPAHMCIEWLLRRFHINEFNQDEFLGLILPYHETTIFVKCLQTMSFTNSQNKWFWLAGIRKAGVPLSKSIVLNRAANDPVFMKFICKVTMEAVKELENKANTLQTLINFYCTTAIGGLEYAEKLNENHLISMLPSILKGLSSNIIDFAAAAFMILAQLITKIQIGEHLLENLIDKITFVQFPTMQSDMILLLILIFQYQSDNIKKFSEDSLMSLITNKWIIDVLEKMSLDNMPISVILVPIVGNCLQFIQIKHKNWLICQEFLEKLINNVRFKENEAKSLIRTVLDNYNKRLSENEIIELNSDDEDDERMDMLISADVQSWYSNFLQQLERQYPSEFDFTIKETMEGTKNISESRKQALKTVLVFRLKSLYSENNSLVYENLYHHNAINRAEAVKFLIANFEDLSVSDQGKDLLKNSLLDRLNDDNSHVIKEVLKLSSKKLVEILDRETLIENLLHILNRTQLHQSNDGYEIVLKVIKHLTKESVFQGCDLNTILLGFMPFFLLSDANERSYINEILTNDICNAIPFLNDCKKLKKLESNEKITKEFKKLLKNSKNLPKPEEILLSMKQVKENYLQKSFNCTYLLILLTSSFKNNSQATITTGLQAFEIIEKLQKKFQLLLCQDNFRKAIEVNKISLELCLDLIVALAESVNFDDVDESLKFLLKLYENLITRSSSSEDLNEKNEYSKALKQFLESAFQSTTNILLFLSNFFISDRVTNMQINPELQIRSLKLFNLIATCVKNKNCEISLIMFVQILLGLNCEISFVRNLSLTALDILTEYDDKYFNKYYKIISKKVLKSREEIQLDCEQFSLILFIILDPSRIDKKKETKDEKDAVTYMIDKFIDILEGNKSKLYLKAYLLQSLKHINNLNMMKRLLNLGNDMLDDVCKNDENNMILDECRGKMIEMIIQRFDNKTVKLLNNRNENGWKFVERSLKMHKVLVVSNGKVQSISGIVMDVFEEHIFAALISNCKEELTKLFLNCITHSQDNALTSSGNKLMKRIDLNCKYVVDILQEMKDICQSPKNITTHGLDLHILNTNQWKLGTTLLEILQNKKKVSNYHILMPLLFDILKKCLEFEEQTSLEYVKQLILSCLLHFCQLMDSESSKKLVPNNIFRMDLVVQCIRATQNPQTHHHALLFLSHCANIIPEQVLYNIMNIFTFMGSAVVRNEDAFSFQIISNIIESVIPMLVKTNSEQLENVTREDLVVPVLKVFSDIILDVPEHKRLLLYTKLLRTLGVSKYLWMFLCVVFESHVVNDEQERTHRKTIPQEEFPKRIQIALQITKDFEPNVVLETCVSLLTYLQELPVHQPEISDGQKVVAMDVDTLEKTLFDVAFHTATQNRHFKYVILQFISALTSSTEFINSIALLDAEETHKMKPFYQNFIIKILSYIPDVTASTEKHNDATHTKYWKVMLHHSYDILDNSISLLTPDMFLVVVHGLLLHQLPSVRKKVIELLITKLQYKSDYFDNCNENNLLNLLNPLNQIIDTIVTNEKLMENATSADVVYIQQIALIAIKLLSKLMAIKYMEDFKFILNKLIRITKKRETFSEIILAAIVLAITEISSNLRANSISHIPKYMPILIEILQKQSETLLTQPPDNVSVAIVTGIQKLYEVLPLFLGSYTVDVLHTLIKIWVGILPYLKEDQARASAVANKLKLIWTKVATVLPIRVLIPNCYKIYNNLIETKQYTGIKYLMDILIECFEQKNGQEINSEQMEISQLFMKTVEFRINMLTESEEIISYNDVNEIEAHILQAFVTLILKLSENSFRPIYQKVYNWSFREVKNPNAAITYFLLSSKISDSLKSLFVLFASDFIQDAADLLDKCNREKSEVLLFNDEKHANEKTLILIENILKTITNIFLHDSKGFINPHRFDILMQPIVDQLQNSIIFNTNIQPILINCIAQLAVVVSNDTLWKQLNYQVLLKTRSNISDVRISSFNCCIEMARKLGEDFSSLLPETIPFIAELLEDDQIDVEKNTRKGVQELEKILGESLQKYF